MSLIVRIGLALFATISSVALAGTLLVASYSTAHAYSSFTEYPTQPDPWGIAFDYTHGNVWVAEPACDSSPVCSNPGPGVIGKYKMATPGTNQKNYNPPVTYNPVFLVVDAKGNIWFTDPTHNAIGQLIPSTNTWKEWTVPTANAAPYDLLLDKNGNLWFTEMLGNSIGYLNTSSLTFVETPTPSKGSAPYGITKDAQGNIWFTENMLPQIGTFKPTSNGMGIAITEIPIETGSNPPTPHLITIDSAGIIWYSEGFAGQVGKYDPVLKTHQDYPVSAGITQTHISGIGVDSKGMVWFNDSLSARIGTLNPTNGAVTAIQLSYSSAHPHDGLLIDKSDDVWITEQFGYRLGEVVQGTSQPPGGPVSAKWYFAEGRVGTGYTESFTLNNPNPTNDCAVNVEYLYTLDGGNPTTKTVSITVPHSSRMSESVNSDLGISPTQSPGASVGAAITTTNGPACPGIVAERTISSTANNIDSGNSVMGATHLNTTFYFADMPTGTGYTSDIAVLNNTTNTAHITINYVSGGSTVKTQTATVSPTSRGTIVPVSGLPAHAAAVITSDQTVEVERSDYFNSITAGNAGTVSGEWSTFGGQALAGDWLFANGNTGTKSQEYLAIANLDPGNHTATITITQYYSKGITKTFSLVLNAQSQVVWDVNLNATGGPTAQFATEVSASGANVVVEREMFFKYRHTVNKLNIIATGGTDVLGQVGPASYTAYSFADGSAYTGNDEVLALQNPTGSAENVHITLVNGLGVVYSPPVTALKAHSGIAIDIASIVIKNMVHQGDGQSAYQVWMLVQTNNSTAYFTAERLDYWNTGGSTPSQGGSAVFGYYGY